MKFADKYEILEMVTSGRVSTFLARERATQEPVVVYTFECAGASAGELNTASIIARFAALAPSPPGIIVKAGFDEASSSAFITTKMPESAALQEWARAYHAFGKRGSAQPAAAPAQPAAKPMGSRASDETAELSAAELKAYFAQSAAQKEKKPADGWGTAEFAVDGAGSSQSGGEFTRLFRELNAFQPVRPAEPPIPPKGASATDATLGQRLGGVPLGGAEPPSSKTNIAAPAESSPGAFTREFLGLSSTPSEVTPSSTGTHEPAENGPGAFTREFLGVSSPAPPPSTPTGKQSPSAPTGPPSIFGGAFSSPSKSAGPSTDVKSPAPTQKETTGEFTKFFRDPFEHPGAPDTSARVPDLASTSPPAQQQGDFTKVFGSPGGVPEGPPMPHTEADSGPAPGSFTQIFGDNSEPRSSQLGMSTLNTNPNLRPTFQEPVIAPTPPRPAVPPQTDPFFAPTPPRPAPVSDQPFMNRPVSSTTDVFRPGAGAPPIEDVPSGPSEFTVFLNRSQLKAVLPPDAQLPSEKPAAGQPQGFAPPPITNPFNVPPPPPVPKPAMPAAPVIPKPAIPSSAPKPASMWPLITVLTVLLAIGAMLVMYFVMKH